ncbi:MAG TPA: TonB-dependent receptor [Methylotenera sp.]|nr:TonB-dependent receptor [Methylotenera sp.]
MKKSIIASLVGLAFTTSAFPEETINLKDVVITASRVPQTRESVIADVSVIDLEEIQRGGQSSLIELLQTQPGIEITSNGGPGKAAGIYMRGTNSGHVVVLVDGMRIASATFGTTTFENLPIAQIERIEILRGPATSLYGQDAIGGVIQIFTKKGEGKPKFYGSVGYGTYDTKTIEAGTYGRINDTSFALNLSSSDTNSFSALNTKNPNFKDNDPYKNFAFNASLSQKLAEGHEIGVQLFNSDGHTRFDNSFNLGNFSSKADIEQQSLALTSKNQFTSSWLSNLKVGYSKDKVKSYDEIDPFVNPFNPTKFNTEQTQINWQNDLNLPVGTLTLMYDRLEEDVKSTTAYDKTNRVNEGYVASYLANIGPHSIQLSLRDDHNSQFGNDQTGGGGYGYSINPNWRVTASYGSALKAPTFNDLYYPGFNNPKLQPEKSDNVEASLRYQDPDSNLSATIYENRIRNLIAFDFSTSTIENLNKTVIQGLTVAGGQRWGNFQLNANVDVQSPRDEKTDNLLARRANRHGAINLSYNLGDWRFGAEAIASSTRYNNLANTVKLDGYALFNLITTYKVNQDWSIQARANNIFDKNYVLAVDGNNIDYKTPGSNLFVSVRYQPE